MKATVYRRYDEASRAALIGLADIALKALR
jgi:hypothetical protein